MTHTAFIIHTLTLIGLVTGATFAGTSNLFAAYLAGASISWWDSEVPHPEIVVEQKSSTFPNPQSGHGIAQPQPPVGTRVSSNSDIDSATSDHCGPFESSGSAMYHKYFSVAVNRILKPFFFASIGFAIPITDMFRGEIVWKGIIFSILMLFGKVVTGGWLIRWNIYWPKVYIPKSIHSIIMEPASCFKRTSKERESGKKASTRITNAVKLRSRGLEDRKKRDGNTVPGHPVQEASNLGCSPPPESSSPASSKIDKPLSLYPAAMLGTAMTSRGEIGFLIASLAETTGLFASRSEARTGSSKIYLIVTWAIVLCTVIGPLSIGMLTKRVRRLQSERERTPGANDPLGPWGVK
ncbi:hypothetical protein FQN49_008176 [Arthroderma sp. PD_2]|nr:hypothetical protein FQN49_008176 [Arthroderma sp. PD_2]